MKHRCFLFIVISLFLAAACGGPLAEPDPPLDDDLIGEVFADETTDFGPYTFERLIEDVAIDVDAFWADAYGENYRSPSGVEAYQTGDTPGLACNISATTAQDNAFYCPRDEGIAYHVEFLEGMFKAFGDFAVAMVLAHEWGHHIYTLTTTQTSYSLDFVIQEELQADCLAGGWATHAGKSSGLFVLEDGDLEKATTYLLTQNDPSINWFDPGDHGTAEERVAAFLLGLNEGVGRCFDYEHYVAGPVIDLGPYTLPLPRDAEWEWHDSRLGDQFLRTTMTDHHGVKVGVDAQHVTLSAEASFGAVADLWSDESMTVLGEPLVLDDQVTHLGASAAAVLYDQDLEGTTAHGLLIIVFEGNVGTIIDAYRLIPAPTDPDAWDPVRLRALSILKSLR